MIAFSRPCLWLFASIAIVSCSLHKATADDKLDISKLKPGDKLEFRFGDERKVVEFSGAGPQGTVLVKMPEAPQPVPLPTEFLRKPTAAKAAKEKAAENSNAAPDTENPFATEEEKASSPRTWKDRSGKFQVEARLVRREDGNVILRRSDEKEIAVAVEKLSDEDQKYLANLRPNSRSASAAAKPAAASPAGEESTDMHATGGHAPFVSTDFHDARLLDVDGSAIWSYAPDLVSASEKLAAVRVGLRSVDFFDKPLGIFFLPAERKAFVSFYNDFKSHSSKIQLCNLQTKQVESSSDFAANEGPIDMASDGSIVLSQVQGNDNDARSELRLYVRQGNGFKPLKAWKPFVSPSPSPGEDIDKEVKWAAFVDPKHILAVSAFGKLVLWEVPELKPIWMTKIAFASVPSFSAGRKYVAFLQSPDALALKAAMGEAVAKRKRPTGTTTAISIVSIADGIEAAHIPLELSQPGIASIALSDEGNRLAMAESGRVRVWDLKTQEVVRDFGFAGSHVPSANHVTWTAENFLLLDHSMLVDVERRVAIWNYSNMHDICVVRDGKVWFLDNASGHESKVLTGAELPHKEALAEVAKLKPEDVLIIHPGLEVSLDVDINGDSDDVAAARTELEARLKNNGMKLVPDSQVRLVASVRPGENRTVKYRMGRIPIGGDTREIQVTTQVLSLSFQVGGDTVWKYESSTSPPGHLQLEEGETVQQAVERSMKQQEDYFPKRCATIWIPGYLARMPGAKEEERKPPQTRPVRQRDARVWAPIRAAA